MVKVSLFENRNPIILSQNVFKQRLYCNAYNALT